MPTFGSLFSGIGGLDLGLERAGWECQWQVEIDEWCRRVLARHWPNVSRWDDATTFPPSDAGGSEWSTRWFGQRVSPEQLAERLRVDLVCGGFPCQPVSLAGKRRGQDDERWLWPEFARIVRLLRPRFVLVENVPGLLARGMGDVLGDLAACGYDAEWDCIPAAAVGAPHLRYRVFIVAYANGKGVREQSVAESGSSGATEPQLHRTLADTSQSVGNGGNYHARGSRESIFLPLPQSGDGIGSTQPLGDWWATEPDVGRVAHGVPHRVDRLRGLGNAVVPQVAERIGRRLMKVFEGDLTTR